MSLQLSPRENGARKKRENASSGSTPIAKRMRVADTDEKPEANPNTIDGVRDKNRAMAIGMREKQRWIAFLTRKCEVLFKQRVVADAQLRCLQRQWLQLLDALRTMQQAMGSEVAEHASVNDYLVDMERMGDLRIEPDEVKLELPEWFVTIARDTDGDVALSSDVEAEDEIEVKRVDGMLTEKQRVLQAELRQRQQDATELLRQVLAAISDKTGGPATEFPRLLQEKQEAMEKMLLLKDEILVMKQRLRDAQHDLEAKEVERHQACRDYDRIRQMMETHGNSVSVGSEEQGGSEKNGSRHDEKVNASDESSSSQHESTHRDKDREKKLMEDMKVLLNKLTQERATVASMQRELERLRASEEAGRKQEGLLKQEHEDQVQRLRTENEHLSEEISKFRHKANDMEQHLHDKWNKKLTKLQGDTAKAKAQIDSLTVKNAALREKLSVQSVFRDQLTELKSDHEALQRECTKLRQQVDMEQAKTDRFRSCNDNKEIAALQEQVALLKDQNRRLQALIDDLKKADSSTPNDAQRREDECRAELLQVQKECSSLRTAAKQAQLDLQAIQDDQIAVQQESDVLVTEIETLNKEMEAIRHAKKKVAHQLEEKRASAKKLQSQLIKESDARAHCFEELSAARLQLSSLSQISKQEKATLDAAKETIQAHETELQALKEYVKQLEAERDTASAERVKMQCENDTTKQLYEAEIAHKQQQHQLQERKSPCEQCELYRKKQEDLEHQLAAAKFSASGGGSALSDVERLELQDLQKMLKCSVCQDRTKDVIITKCFHMFCKECIDNNLKSRNRKCPTCKKMFGHDDVKNVWFT